MFKLSNLAMAGAVAAIVSACGFAMPANAVIIDDSPAGNPGSNVVFNPCSGLVTSGTTVQGCLNNDHSVLVNFTSTSSLVVNGGQARIEAASGTFNNLTIGFADPNSAIPVLQLNIITASSDATGQVQFIVDFFGDTPDFVSGFFDVGNGENRFQLDAEFGELIDTITVISNVGIQSVAFDDVRQVRVGSPVPVPGVSVPEPATLALFGAGLLGLGMLRRRHVI